LKAALKIGSVGGSQPGTSWLTLLLLLVVLAPSACLLWFMNRAVKNERLAVRQKLVDAYREHLVVGQQRLDVYWKQRADELENESGRLSPAEVFAREVREGRADAVVIYDANGKVIYPNVTREEKKLAQSPAAIREWQTVANLEVRDAAAAAEAYSKVAEHETNATFAARALQAQARCLVRSGKKREAVAVLLEKLSQSNYGNVSDSQGRLLVPNAELMALELLGDTQSNRVSQVKSTLERTVLDYGNTNMPAAQRRFLMRQLQRFGSQEDLANMLAAEDLAAAYVETGRTNTGAGLLRPASLPGVWQFTSVNGRVVLLHKSAEILLKRLRGAGGLPNSPEGTVVGLVPPGREVDGAFVSLPAGSSLPDWKLALSLNDQKLFDAATNQRIAAYVWICVLVVLAVIVLALFILRLIRRQMAVARLRNDLVANVTHELKTPLSGMRLLVDTLLNSEKLHEPTVREYLTLIAKENLRLSRLIDNFLAFSRMERNKYALDFKSTPAQAIVDGAAEAVQERFNSTDCHFEIRTAPELPNVVADPDAMVTAVVNLLDNAWKYSGEHKSICLSASAENGHVTFSVRDNGIGLTPREAKRVFKRFYQVDQKLSRSAGGCGLGLSIVKFIVTAHHGEVRVESEPGKGSTFSIDIPSTAPAKTQNSSTQHPERLQTSNSK
jgi:signal transduction histidine kinase